MYTSDKSCGRFVWEKYKFWWKKSKSDINGQISHVHGQEDNIVKISILPNLICMIQGNPSKNPTHLFCGHWQTAWKLTWKGERPRIANTVLKEKTKVRGLTPPGLKNVLQNHSNQRSRVSVKEQTDQCNNRKPVTGPTPQTGLEQYVQYYRAKIVLSWNSAGTHGYPRAKKKKKKNLDTKITSFTKITPNGS